MRAFKNAALILVLSSLTPGCATLSSGTLVSELSNDRVPGSASAPPSSAAVRSALASAGPTGASCDLGSDCASGACVHHLCFDLGNAATPIADGAVAATP